ncbi:unnamed protein product [Didymodactylos carnosus]|uniref:GH18 domain-containing protein n=1 Tax=Didymodactylos carnosus TaxID=1234261 RepID=A0A814JXM8_9BILA|nr:unnamed protein product [Didymodactylos carnosus]CAF1043866.1 unnamed protein product [Didymodactylos carnosus]CAF3519341.1 unnamed protein product [Didymodactylos carnosus]CAF3813924.1 unnamed protein product [Didymodactylos carnosus]
MQKHTLFVFYILFICGNKLQTYATLRIVCYYTNWSVYRESTIPILYPDSIDPHICTHIHYAFAKIHPVTLNIEPTEKHDTHWTDHHSMPLYHRLYGLKRRNPQLKIILAVGGWSAKSEGFNAVLYNETNRAKFIDQTLKYLRDWNFDGLDLDWEFPGDVERDADSESKIKFDVLVKELRDAVDYVSKSQNKTFLLSAAVAADPQKIDNGYIVENFCRYLDYVNVMSYDYHGQWDNVTGINSPLYKSHTDLPSHEEWKNVNSSIYYWLERGCPAEKMNIGLAIYGRTFTISNESSTVTIGSESIGGGEAGPFVKENGTLAYFEICQKLHVLNWTSVFDTESQTPYAYNGKQWVGYDNLKSIVLKVLWAKTVGLGGAMLWTLDFDDYTGLFCNHGMFPLTRRIHEMMLDDIIKHLPLSNTTSVILEQSTRLKVTTIKFSDRQKTTRRDHYRLSNLAVTCTNTSTLDYFYMFLLSLAYKIYF